MGNGPQVIGIVGFKCIVPEPKRGKFGFREPRRCLGSVSAALGNNIEKMGEDDREEYLCGLSENNFEGLCKKLKDLGGGLFTMMENECMCEGAMAVGWSHPTKDQLAALKKILEEEGLEVSPLEGDRFCYYG